MASSDPNVWTSSVERWEGISDREWAAWKAHLDRCVDVVLANGDPSYEEEEAEKEEEAKKACRGRHRARQGITWQCHLPFWQAPQRPRHSATQPRSLQPPSVQPPSSHRSSSLRPRAEAGA